jgi:hypothetical protein
MIMPVFHSLCRFGRVRGTLKSLNRLMPRRQDSAGLRATSIGSVWTDRKGTGQVHKGGFCRTGVKCVWKWNEEGLQAWNYRGTERGDVPGSHGRVIMM